MTQQVRLSQFVITYGPGAILEGRSGPRVIPAPDIGLFHANSDLVPENFEISDQRMSQGLLQGARIFRLPSNAEVGASDRTYLYRTRPFPSWSLCLSDGHGGNVGVLYLGNECPVCGRQGRRRPESIRFVRACQAGHLDDVHWAYVVHRGSACGRTDSFLWHGGGGALRQVEIECPDCGRRANLGQAYGQPWPCSGRYPEREAPGVPSARPGCSQQARIIQRQASNLRLPELRSLFTIPPRATRLHNLLQAGNIRSALVGIGLASISRKEILQAVLERLVSQGLASQPAVSEILQYEWQEIRRAMNDVLSPVATDFRGLLLEEFHELMHASRNGFPPVHGPRPSSPAIFEVNPASVRVVPLEGRRLRVTPVSRLQTITVQLGYRREIRGGGTPGLPPALATVTPVSFQDSQNRRWYPGVRYLGEGVFVALEDGEGWHFPLRTPAALNWRSATASGTTYPDHLFRANVRDELHPVFVWWHTFPHLLIRAISTDSGYSSASIRERVYVEIDAGRGRARGGIILYATQPGNDGSLGGMIALAPHFDRIANRALEMLRICSNDPLCAESHFAVGRYCGPACYSCLLISETSCEHRNLWLDREVVLG